MGSTENGHERSAIFHRNGRERRLRYKKRDPVSRKKGVVVGGLGPVGTGDGPG
jgi:hypothetical protein